VLISSDNCSKMCVGPGLKPKSWMVFLQVCNVLCCCVGFDEILLGHAKHAKLVDQSTRIDHLFLRFGAPFYDPMMTSWCDITPPSILLCVGNEQFDKLAHSTWIFWDTRLFSKRTSVRNMVVLKIDKSTWKHNPVTRIDKLVRFNCGMGTVLSCPS
jgi:hypothetical protein